MAVGMALGARQRINAVENRLPDGRRRMLRGQRLGGGHVRAALQLGNLIGIVDRNRYMIDGETEERHAAGTVRRQVARLRLGRRRSGTAPDFGPARRGAFQAWAATDVPVLILAHTIKGKGVDFMENNVVYHYASADSELCARAKASILKEG